MISSWWYARRYLSKRQRLVVAFLLIVVAVSVFVAFNFAFYYEVSYRNARTRELYSRLIKVFFEEYIVESNLTAVGELDGVKKYYPMIANTYMAHHEDKSGYVPVEFCDRELVVELLKQLSFSLDPKGVIYAGYLVALKLDLRDGEKLSFGPFSGVVGCVLPYTGSLLDTVLFVDLSVYIDYAGSEANVSYNGLYIFLISRDYEDSVVNALYERYRVRYISSPSRVAEWVEKSNRLQLLSSMFFSFLALLMGLGIIILMVYREYEGRKRELSILSALGAKTNTIISALLIPLYIALFSGLLVGSILTFFLVIPYYHLFVYGYYRLFGINTYVATFFSVGLTLLVMLLATVLVIKRKVKGLRPMEFLRAEL